MLSGSVSLMSFKLCPPYTDTAFGERSINKFMVMSFFPPLGLMQRLRNRGERDREREREREMRRSSGLRAGSRRDRDR